MIVTANEVAFNNDVGGTILMKGKFRVEVDDRYYDDEIGVVLLGRLLSTRDIKQARELGTTGFKPSNYKKYEQVLGTPIAQFDPSRVHVMATACDWNKNTVWESKVIYLVGKNGKKRRKRRPLSAQEKAGLYKLFIQLNGVVEPDTLANYRVKHMHHTVGPDQPSGYFAYLHSLARKGLIPLRDPGAYLASRISRYQGGPLPEFLKEGHHEIKNPQESAESAIDCVSSVSSVTSATMF